MTYTDPAPGLPLYPVSWRADHQILFRVPIQIRGDRSTYPQVIIRARPDDLERNVVRVVETHGLAVKTN